MGAKQFGARVARVEDPALLTGRARFVDDLKLPGLLHACFVRSPHPHARIGAIDAAPARAMPGVHAVLTADDMPGRLATDPLPMPVPNPAITALRTQRALARREVCYVGETIAVVIADNRYLAEDAAARVVVAFEPLAAVSDCRAALGPGAARTHSDLATNVAAHVPMSYGDVEARVRRSRSRLRGGDVLASRRRDGAGRPRRAREPSTPVRTAHRVVGDPDAAYLPGDDRGPARPRTR